MRWTAAAALAAAIGLLACASAQPQATSYFKSGAGPDMIQILPPPPARGSPAKAADDAAFKATQSLRGTPRWKLAAADADASPQTALGLFSCAAGVKLEPASSPALFHLISRLSASGFGIIEPPKTRYDRLRPFKEHVAATCVDTADIAPGSFPSGHTTMGWAWALVLAEIAPDKATPILQRGRAYGESRVVCGVHYPSDLDAGRTTGAALVATAHANPEFRDDLDKARAELAALRASGGSAPDPEQCKVQDAAGAQQPW